MLTREEMTAISNHLDYATSEMISEAQRSLLDHDAEQRWVIEQQKEELSELRKWKEIVLGAGTDQEAVIRMAAIPYTQLAVASWKQKVEQQAQEIIELQRVIHDYEISVPVATIRCHEQTIQRLREALETIVSGTTDTVPPMCLFGMEKAKEIAQRVLEETKEVT